MKSQALIEKLNETLEGVEDPRLLVGQKVPPAAWDWAEKNGLSVSEDPFAPPRHLYIIGAIPVPWEA